MALTQIQNSGIADSAINTQKIGNDAVTLDKLNAGTDGQIITYDASGNPVAVGPGTDGQVLTSTGAGSPPAFEDAAASVGGANGVDFNDNVKIRSGTGNDFEIYHDGTDSRMKNNTGDVYLDSPSVYIRSDGGSEDAIQAIANGAVNLFHNGTKKLETHSDGVRVINTGADAAVRVLAPSGQNGRIELTADAGADNEDNFRLTVDTDQKFKIYGKPSGTYTEFLSIDQSGRVNVTGGVRLGGNNAANELDDYEEGTFLPTIFGSSSDGTTTYHGSDNRRGHYTKIGREVTVYFTVGWSGQTGSGDLRVGGLPFTVDATSYSTPNGTHQSFGSTYFNNVACPIDSGSFMHLVSYVYGGIGTNMKFLQMQISGDSATLNMTYGANDDSSYTKYIGGTLTYNVA